MARAVASLPVIYREAILLTAVEGMKPSQAAEVCGVSSEAMRQRLTRARSRLAERLCEPEPVGLVSLREVTS
jgi:DNA-directed RNA polymerase specialized sigma24 family protein